MQELYLSYKLDHDHNPIRVSYIFPVDGLMHQPHQTKYASQKCVNLNETEY